MNAADSNMLQMQRERYEIFKAQNLENSHFDVAFDVNGQLIYANKYVLETTSAPFYAMFSEQWKSKDGIIKLDTYKYDDFYRFLHFVYSGTCDLTDECVATMVDIAEFYDVKIFKNFCDEYISKMRCNMNNVFDFLELVITYSLPKSKIIVDNFIGENLSKIFELDQFIYLQKCSVEYLITFRRRQGQEEEKVFEAIYKWVEYQYDEDEDPQKCHNRIEGIKAKMVEWLPYIKFKEINAGYFAKFILPMALFTNEELSAIFCNYFKIRVTVTDSQRRYISGSFIDIFNIYDFIKLIGEDPPIYWNFFKTPPLPNELKKSENAQFYFVLVNNSLQIKKSSSIKEADYLLCEMEGSSDFVFDDDCQIRVTRLN